MIININLKKPEIDKLYKELKDAKYTDGEFGFPSDNTRIIIYEKKLLIDEKFKNILLKYNIIL